MSTSQDKMPFDVKLKYAGDYQVDQILDSLRQRGINLPLEEVRDRLILAMHSHSFTEKIVKQIEACPKRTADMSMKERYAAAGWKDQAEASPGDRETSRAVIENLVTGNLPELTNEMECSRNSILNKIQSAEGRVVASNHNKKGREIDNAR